jgi:hypothetical protein
MNHGIGRAVLALLVVISPHLALAQDAAIVGTITDSSGAVLPGVVVQIVHDADGQPVRRRDRCARYLSHPGAPGVVRLTAELNGFSPASRTDLEVLLGRSIAVNLQPGPLRRAGVRDRHRRSADSSTSPRRPSAATSTRGRCRSFRTMAATG